MKKQINYFYGTKKAFTIVELVVVIAVIAVLAAVLIPTFANIIKKSNLSADKQAVREMNMVLAEWESANGKPANMKIVTEILGQAGYNAENWVCLTAGYKVMWYKPENRLVLVSNLGEVEYPENFDATLFHKAESEFHAFNAMQIEAIQMDFTLGSVTKGQNATSVSSSASVADVKASLSSSNITEEGATAILSTVAFIQDENSPLKSVLGFSESNVYVVAAKEVRTSKTGNASIVTLICMDDQREITSTGEPIPNIAYISSAKGSADNGNTAPQENAISLFNTLVKVNNGDLPTKISIVLEPGMELDCSSIDDQDFEFPERFSGYFGTTDTTNPVIINKAEITSNTKYVETVRFDGSSSKYFLSGIFGAVYGETTIENVIFRNLIIDSPATDYEITEADMTGKLTSSRNTCSIIGGVIDNRQDKMLTVSEAAALGLDKATTNEVTKNNVKYYKDSKKNWWRVDVAGVEAKVVIRNVVVESSSIIRSNGCVGGLIGYIGSSSTNGDSSNGFYAVGKGSVIVENCTVSANVKSLDTKTTAIGYGTAGGIVGFMCRATGWTLTIKDSKFDGKVNGYTDVNAAVGNNQSGRVILTGTNDFSAAQLDTDKTARFGIFAVSCVGTVKASLTNNGTVYYNGAYANIYGKTITENGTTITK